MAKNISQTEKELIKKEYLKGLSYRDIKNKYGYAMGTVSCIVKGLRSHSDSCKIGREQGKGVISDEGRKKLSENGKKAVLKSNKIWTKPEKEFKQILNSINIGVKFSLEIKNLLNIDDDDNAIIYFQYPIQRYLCDFVYPEKKIIFRINGDFWHANPLLYADKDLTKIQKFNKIRDKNKKIYLEKNNWQIIDVWESDIYWRKEFVKKQAIGAVGSISGLHSEGPQFKSEIAYSDQEWSKQLKNIWFKKPKGRPKKEKEKKNCLYCKKEFELKKAKIKYCSVDCFRKSRRKVKNRPSKEQLLKEIQETNYCIVGRKYGVSDNAVRKWLK